MAYAQDSCRIAGFGGCRCLCRKEGNGGGLGREGGGGGDKARVVAAGATAKQKMTRGPLYAILAAWSFMVAQNACAQKTRINATAIAEGAVVPWIEIGLRWRNSPMCTLSQNGYGDCT